MTENENIEARLVRLELEHGICKENARDQKETNQRILEKLDSINEKLDNKITALEKFAVKQGVINKAIGGILLTLGGGASIVRFLF
jgi:hypothetical protein